MNTLVHRLAPYAVCSAHSRGRVYAEAPDALRCAFELDRHRVIACTAFRRVRSKTQVFSGPKRRDHDRTRLTHSIEVAQIARLLAKHLGINETLAETIALAHDLGHPPFGHAGEVALNDLMSDSGGFEHNAHALRVVDYLEHPFPAHRGLNLTYEVREGLIKHVTQFDKPCHDAADPTVAQLLLSGPMPTVEAQAVALADRLAYDLHDLEDAIGAGFIDTPELAAITLWQQAWDEIGSPNAPSIHAIRRPVLDAMLNTLLDDAIRYSLARLEGCASVDDVRRNADSRVGLSTSITPQLEALESLLDRRVYKQTQTAQMDAVAKRVIRQLFNAYLDRPDELPTRFRNRLSDQGAHRVVCDYLAGMTDRFCRAEHARIAQEDH